MSGGRGGPPPAGDLLKKQISRGTFAYICLYLLKQACCGVLVQCRASGSALPRTMVCGANDTRAPGLGGGISGILRRHRKPARARRKPARDPPQARKRSPTKPNKPTRDPPQSPTSPQAWMMDDISTTLGGSPPRWYICHPSSMLVDLLGFVGDLLWACGGSLAGLWRVP